MAIFGRKICKENHLMDSSWKYCPICLAPICGWLVLMENKKVSKVYTIHEGKNKVGSGADCEIRILLKGISRNHILLRSVGNDHFVIDLGSKNGLMVNFQELTNSRLIDGDILTLANFDFKFKCL